MPDILNSLYHYNLIEKIFHTTVGCLKQRLSDCETVLDLGCGPSSPIQYCNNIKYSVGVETFEPYLKQSMQSRIHSKYLLKNILDIELDNNSFDAVVLIEVIEHMTKEDGMKILAFAQKWAKKKIILTTPNGYFPMDNNIDGNVYQKHISGWSINELRSLGYRCRGLAGLKYFYHSNNASHSLLEPDPYSNYRFKPPVFFYFINCFFQLFSYYLPGKSFGIWADKSL